MAMNRVEVIKSVQKRRRWPRARNAIMDGCRELRDCRYLLYDRDAKYSASFLAIVETGSVKTLVLRARSPNLNAYAGTLDKICKSGVFVEDNVIWRRLLASGDARI